MIKMEHVGFRYEGTEILHDVNFAMKDGEYRIKAEMPAGAVQQQQGVIPAVH